MKIKEHIFLIIVSIFIWSCHPKSTPSENIETIKFTFSGDSPEYKDVFKTTTIIPLETNQNCLIQRISQMEVWEDKMFILDWKSNALFVFNSEGKFLNKTGRVGHGPGEYIRPRYFFINKEEQQVKVFDAPTKKLMCFNIDGKLIKEIKLDNYLRAVGETKNGYWGFYSNMANTNVDDEQKKHVKFITFNENGEVEDYIKGEKSIDNLNVSNSYIANTVDHCVSFVEPYCPDIYSFKNNEISVRYIIEYSGRFPSENVLNKIERLNHPMTAGDKDLMRSLSGKYPGKYIQFFENKDWILLLTTCEATTLLYNKKTKKTHEFSNYLSNENGWETYFPMCCGLAKNVVYGAVSYSVLSGFTEKNQEISDKKRDFLKELLEKMEMGDNPLIVKYEIKN